MSLSSLTGVTEQRLGLGGQRPCWSLEVFTGSLSPVRGRASLGPGEWGAERRSTREALQEAGRKTLPFV